MWGGMTSCVAVPTTTTKRTKLAIDRGHFKQSVVQTDRLINSTSEGGLGGVNIVVSVTRWLDYSLIFLLLGTSMQSYPKAY